MTLPYNLDIPNKALRLPKALTEVSGIAVTSQGTCAWAINDEQGRLFLVDLNTGEVRSERKFAKRGDYEGIEVVEDSVVVVRSDGRLWQVRQNETIDHDSPLSKKADVEGLALDAHRSRLLVACKGPSGPEAAKDERCIYSLCLPSYEWQAQPAYVVRHDDLGAFIASHPECGVRARQAKDFSPSAIAVEPSTGQIYLLSSRAKLLVVLDGDAGHLVWVAALRRRVHAQPEGLSFDASGSLYLTNEGRTSQATLLRFDRLERPPLAAPS